MSIQSIAEAAQVQVQDGSVQPEDITTLVSIISSSSNELEHFSSDTGVFTVAEVCSRKYKCVWSGSLECERIYCMLRCLATNDFVFVLHATNTSRAL